METNEIKLKVKEYLSRSIMNEEINDDDNIFELGINSLFVIQFILFIEKNFGIELEDEELDPEKLKTVNHIVRLIEAKTERGN